MFGAIHGLGNARIFSAVARTVSVFVSADLTLEAGGIVVAGSSGLIFSHQYFE